MVLKAEWAAIDRGTHSEYIIAAEGTPGYGVSVDGEWMVFDNEQDAQKYAAWIS